MTAPRELEVSPEPAQVTSSPQHPSSDQDSGNTAYIPDWPGGAGVLRVHQSHIEEEQGEGEAPSFRAM